MKLDVQLVFCEVISGLGLIVLVGGIFVLSGTSSVEQLASIAAKYFGGLELAGILFAAYVAGVIVDAVGVVLDEHLLYRLAARRPTEVERRTFLRIVSAHVLEWRTNVWNYYFCFRNLLVLAVPNAVVWTVVAGRTGLWSAVVAFSTICGTGVLLFVASKSLLVLYYQITIDVGTATTPGGGN